MKTSDRLKKYPRPYWIIPLLVFIIPLIIDHFVRDSVYKYSLQTIYKYQAKFESLLIKPSNDTSTNTNNQPETSNIITDFLFRSQSDNAVDDNQTSAGIRILYKTLSIFYSNLFFMLLCLVIYNFLNVYKTFILTLSIFFSNYLSSFLCFIYRQPRPYMVNSKITPLFLFTDWGYPDNKIMTSVAFFATFYKVIIKSRFTKKKTGFKIAVGTIFCILEILLIVVSFFAGMVTFEEIYTSICMGLVVYLVIFGIFDAKLNNPKQFHSIIQIKIVYIFIINIVLIVFIYLLYFYIHSEEMETFLNTNIQSIYNRYKGNIALEFNDQFRLHKANFCNMLNFFSNLIVLLTLKLELKVTYKNNFELWKKNNFESIDNRAFSGNTMYTDFKFVKGTQWNHTGGCKTFIRLIFIIILGAVTYIPEYLFSRVFTNNKDDGELMTFCKYLFIIVLPNVYLCFGMFYGFKWIFRRFKLANHSNFV